MITKFMDDFEQSNKEFYSVNSLITICRPPLPISIVNKISFLFILTLGRGGHSKALYVGPWCFSDFVLRKLSNIFSYGDCWNNDMRFRTFDAKEPLILSPKGDKNLFVQSGGLRFQNRGIIFISYNTYITYTDSMS